MKRDEYLADPAVRAFIEWCPPLLDARGVFSHKYALPLGAWSCVSLFDAFRRYEWRGRDFEENEQILAPLRTRMREALRCEDTPALIAASEDVLRWGGVLAHNRQALHELGDGAPDAFSAAIEQLRPADADTERVHAVWRMNSGFTKLYAMLLDEFPIYDGRVGGALGYLMRRHLEGRGVKPVPEMLRFPWGAGQGWVRGDPRKNRDPSSETLWFPAFRNTRHHAIANIRAAWLLGELCQSGEFGGLAPERRLWALQSALFMIGYEVPRG